MIGTPALFIRSRASVFEPIASIASGGGPIQVEPGRLDRAREVGVLGQEAVSRVDRLGAGGAGGLEDPFLVQVALCRSAGSEQERLVRAAHVERAAVGLGVHRDGADLELPERAEDPDRDLAPVGNEHFREEFHGRRILPEGWPSPISSPSRASSPPRS